VRTWIAVIFVFGLGPLIERTVGARLATASMLANAKNWLLTFGLNLLLLPLGMSLAAEIVAMFGGGVILLPESGWQLLWTVPVFAFAMELADYLFHRAQHRSAFLWSMHSLHHSDAALGVTSSVRHFWAESLIRTLFLYPIVFVVFRPSATLLGIYALLQFWGNIDHLDVRWSFGRFAPVWTSPQYHRIHHARDEGLRDRNFAALFPVIDLVFGTYYRPAPTEYPASGLATGEEPCSVADLLLWPLRRRRFQQEAAVPQ
jgi:sterol desaturase/sphingolipid hydroxylase (fatty acid hydroxylase superfamily)